MHICIVNLVVSKKTRYLSQDQIDTVVVTGELN